MDRAVFRKISYGLYLICSAKDGRFNGQIANSLFQVTSDPPMVAVSIHKENLTHEFIQASRKFSVSVLSQETPMTFIGRFGFKSGRDINKFEGTRYKIGETGVPVLLDHATAYMELVLISEMDFGSHTIFVGQVVAGETLNQDEPMTYAYYRNIKGGKSPKLAPTFMQDEPGRSTVSMTKYICSVCGYVYDPALGDPDGGIKAGTPFEDLPGDWICPICGADKAKFEAISG